MLFFWYALNISEGMIDLVNDDDTNQGINRSIHDTLCLLDEMIMITGSLSDNYGHHFPYIRVTSPCDNRMQLSP